MANNGYKPLVPRRLTTQVFYCGNPGCNMTMRKQIGTGKPMYNAVCRIGSQNKGYTVYHRWLYGAKY